MKAVRLALLLAALLCLSGFIGIFVPMKSIAHFASRYGMKSIPPGPVFEYLFRLAAAVVAGCGVFYLVLAISPRRHGPLVPVGGGAILFVGLVLLLTGFSSGMVTEVFILDFLSCVLVGSAILVTWLIWGRGKLES